MADEHGITEKELNAILDRLVSGKAPEQIMGQGGPAIGMVLSLSMTGLMERMLYGITAADPATLAMASVVLGSVALVAMFIKG
jgi:hypothetical protein